MALQGMDFKKILGYYYRDTRLVNIRGLQNRSVALARAGTTRQ
jgi:hypothetical protein